MGKLAVKRYFALMFLIVQIVLTIFTFVGLFGGDNNPIGHTASAMLVYILPLLIAANALTMICWLIARRWIWAALPFLTILCCIPYIGTLYQLNPSPKEDPGRKTLKVASYNVARFGREAVTFITHDILAEMKKEKVDVLCIQEYNEEVGDKKSIDIFKDYFPYSRKGNNDMIIYSRYPIGESKNIPFEQTNNSAMWADIDVHGKRLRVFNAHLETTGFNRTMHQAGKMIKRGQNVETNALLNAIYGNYTLGMIIRAGQAAMVSNEVNNSNIPCIVCGDFNDVPYSYVYNTMLGNLVDGFKECGNGFMYTYRGSKMVRIDYIFHDKQLEGLSYYKLPLTYSDHYPVFMQIGL
ncbi:MAG: endonuclease/exonuclease/phosphatase family protein [Prevotella sp.]